MGPVYSLPVQLQMEALVALMTVNINHRILSRGFDLPNIPFIAFVQPLLHTLPGVLAVHTDVAYANDTCRRSMTRRGGGFVFL